VSAIPQRSVLLVEDEALLAMDIETVLGAVGFQVIGPASTSAEAYRLILSDKPDVTILDLNLGTEMVFPVLDYLDDVGIPFLILSGHSHQMVPARHAGRPFLQKPCEPGTLLRAVRGMLQPAAGGQLKHA